VKKVILLMVVLSGCAGWHPAQKWSHTDSVFEVSYFAAMMTQWSHTDVMQHQCAEPNPALGQCSPDARMSPAVFFPVSIVTHAVVSAMLPPDARRVWQATSTGFAWSWTRVNLWVHKTADYDIARAQCAEAQAKLAPGEMLGPIWADCNKYNR